MLAIIILIYIVAFAALLYCSGLGLVWLFEFRKKSLYQEMRKQVQVLENLRLSMAMLHVKMYKISEDYRRRNAELEKMQQFILEKWLFIKKSTLKTKYKNLR